MGNKGASNKRQHQKPTIIIGADHAGVALKKYLHARLQKSRYAVEDLGSFDPARPDDYTDIAIQVGRRVAKNQSRKGILICRTGTGMAMAANKIPGIRAALCYDTYSAVMARKDNDANIITLRSRRFPQAKAWNIVRTWLSTPFSNKPRHKRRLAKLASLDR